MPLTALAPDPITVRDKDGRATAFQYTRQAGGEHACTINGCRHTVEERTAGTITATIETAFGNAQSTAETTDEARRLAMRDLLRLQNDSRNDRETRLAIQRIRADLKTRKLYTDG